MNTKQYPVKISVCTYVSHGGCTNPTAPGRSYCESHLFVVYQKGTAHSKRKKDIRIANQVWDLQSELNKAIEELEAEGFDCYGRQ